MLIVLAKIAWHVLSFFSELMLNGFSPQALLKEHANDNPKFSYTGRPIVKWPKRVRLFLLSICKTNAILCSSVFYVFSVCILYHFHVYFMI